MNNSGRLVEMKKFLIFITFITRITTSATILFLKIQLNCVLSPEMHQFYSLSEKSLFVNDWYYKLDFNLLFDDRHKVTPLVPSNFGHLGVESTPTI